MSEMDIWCKGNCYKGSEDPNATYHEDNNKIIYKDNNGNNYVCDKHHWTCDKCNKIVQIG